MVPVLNSPMRADGAGEGLGIEVDLAGIAADLLAARPQTGPGVLLEGQARDPGDAGNQRLPLGIQLTGGVEHLYQPVLLAAMTPPVHRLMAVEGVVLGAEFGQRVMQGGLVPLHLDQQAIVGLGGPRDAVLLAMQGIGGEQHAADPQFGDQRWHGRDLAGCPGHLLVGQDEGDVAGEGAEHMSRFPVVQVVEAAAQRLAIEGDGALPGHLDRPVQRVRMTAESSLEIVPLERQEQTAQRVHGWRSSEARPEGSVQAIALDGDEGDDLLVGGRTRQNRQNREQQQMAQAIALPLRAAWIVDSFERGKQRTKRHQGDIYQLRTSLQQIRYRTLRVPALRKVGSGRRGRTAWPCARVKVVSWMSEKTFQS